MKVIKNNMDIETESTVAKNATPKFPTKAVCENCESEIELDEVDVEEGEFGLYKFICPCCGKESFADCGITLTSENVSFPKHYFCSEDGINISDDEINKMVKKCIETLRNSNDKDVYSTFTEIGNTFVFVQRFDGDENFEVVVSKDYYDTIIDYTEEDKIKFDTYYDKF